MHFYTNIQTYQRITLQELKSANNGSLYIHRVKKLSELQVQNYN